MTPDEFWNNVATGYPDECWEWGGRRNRPGVKGGDHGVLWFKGKTRKAHRVAWELATGKSPGSMRVLHTCDWPPCCNPEHLYLGTAADNVRDMLERGRHVAPKGESCGTSKLTEADVAKIKAGLARKVRHKDLAETYGISIHTIGQISQGRTWRHVEAAK